MDLELHRTDLHQTRFVHSDPPAPQDGQALLRIESFGLTSNNITYAVFGEAMKYWDFFPASDPDWGKLNVWGYAHVEDSRHPDLAAGTRVYGYLPCGSHLLVVPGRTAPGCRRSTRATATSRPTPSTRPTTSPHTSCSSRSSSPHT